MATPDLAGLLRSRPKRQPEEAPAAPPQPLPVPNVDRPAGSGRDRDEDALAEGAAEPVIEASPGAPAPGAPLESARTRQRREARLKAASHLDTVPEAAPQVTGPDPAAAPRTNSPTRAYRRPLSLLIGRSKHQQLADLARDRGTTNTALILRAVNETHARLWEVLAADGADTAPGDLFAVPQGRRVEPATEVRVRVTDAQLAALDGLTSEHGVSRSRLVNAALSLYLPAR